MPATSEPADVRATGGAPRDTAAQYEYDHNPELRDLLHRAAVSESVPRRRP